MLAVHVPSDVVPLLFCVIAISFNSLCLCLLEPLGQLLALPEHRMGRYMNFLGDYLDIISDVEPDYVAATDALQHFQVLRFQFLISKFENK